MVVNASYYYNHGVEVNTRAVVSQKVRIFGYSSFTEGNRMEQIGALAQFSISESRAVEELRGVGSGDRIMELIPGVTSAASIEANRVALWLSNIFQVFGYKSGVDGLVRSLKHHRWPFDIRQELVFSAIDKGPTLAKVKNAGGQSNAGIIGSNATEALNTITPVVEDGKILVTYYEGCWMRSYSMAFQSTQAVVAENCGIICSDVVAGPSQIGDFDNDDYLSSNRTRALRVRQEF